jgi:tRNA1(Val) A37 N6-methylase TrmN6
MDAAQLLLAETGVLVLCYPVSEAQRAEQAANARGFFLKERLTVVPKAGKAALIVVDVFVRVPCQTKHSQLIVRDQDARWSAEFRAIRRRFGMPDTSVAAAG